MIAVNIEEKKMKDGRIAWIFDQNTYRFLTTAFGAISICVNLAQEFDFSETSTSGVIPQKTQPENKQGEEN